MYIMDYLRTYLLDHYRSAHIRIVYVALGQDNINNNIECCIP